MAGTKPRARSDLSVVSMGGETVIYDERHGDLHHLTPTASLVFQVCDGTATVRELASDISEVFGAPVKRVEREVRSLVREFREIGLLEGRLALAGREEHVHEHADRGPMAFPAPTPEGAEEVGRGHGEEEHDLREEIREQKPVSS
jgi:PqqD family protein of HPr-rel-A system